MTNINPPIAFTWTDLETTGLNQKTGSILEVGCLLTDKQLNVRGRFESLVIPEVFDGSAESLGMDEYVTKMHTKNGLLDALSAALDVPGAREQLSIEAVAARFAEFLRSCGMDESLPRWFDTDEPEAQTKPYLAGSTVGFDKAWMEEHMAEVMPLLHYRVYDVSTLKIAAEFYRPEIRWTSAGAHRAMDDIVESIEHAGLIQHEMLLRGPDMSPIVEVSQVVSGDSNAVATGNLSIKVG
jgi:oligoribonuclease